MTAKRVRGAIRQAGTSIVLKDGATEQVTIQAGSNVGAITFTLPATSGTVLTRTSVDTGANRLQDKDLDDATVRFVDSGDTTKRIVFQAAGQTTGTTVTFETGATTTQTWAFQDAPASDFVVGRATTDTLTNKSINANDNSITNLTDASLSGLAAINATKIADGSVDNTEFQRLGTAGSAGSGNLVTTDGAQVLTQKTYDADAAGNILTNIDDGNIKAGAGIQASKLGLGTVDDTELDRLNGVTSNVQTQLDGKQPYDGDLVAISALTGTGLIARTGTDSAETRTITAGSTKISVSDGGGVAGNPTIDVAEANLSLNNIGGTLGPAKGGTGVANNAASTLTISGNFGTTLTVSGATAVTLPTTGTLATLAGAETLTNKTISGASNTITNVSLTTGVTGTLPIGNGGTGQTTQTAAFDALAPTTTKGDLIVHNGTDNVREAVGTDGFVLQADSTQASGVRWAAAGSGVVPGEGAVYSNGTALATAGAFAGNANKMVRVNSGTTALEYSTLVTGTTGTDFNIAFAAGTTTFHLPDASATARGVLTTGTQTFGGLKTFNTDLSVQGALLGKNGTVGSPSYSFTSDTDTGLYWPGSGSLGFVSNSSEVMTMSPTLFTTTIPVTLGTAGSSTNTLNGYLRASFQNADTNVATTDSIEFRRASSGTAAAGFGGRLALSAQNAAGTFPSAAYIRWEWTNAGSGTEASKLGFWTRTGGAALVEQGSVNGSGAWTFGATAGAVTHTFNGRVDFNTTETTVPPNGIRRSATNTLALSTNSVDRLTANATTGVQFQGTATNDNATAGWVGEQQSTSNSGNTSFGTSAAYGGDHSITLDPGDWNVTFVVEWDKATATTMTQADAFIGTATGDNTTGRVVGDNYAVTAFSTGSVIQGMLNIANFRVSTASSTTRYLKTRAVYTGTAPVYRYRISARRIR